MDPREILARWYERLMGVPWSGLEPLRMWRGPADSYPLTYAESDAQLGAGREGSAWYHEHVVERHHDSAFAGVPKRWYVKVHRVVEPYAEEGFRRAAERSSYRIERLGSHNYRRIRFRGHGRLSRHAGAMAFDVDPVRNFALDLSDTGLDEWPQPWSPAWLELWPHGVDREFVLSMASCGFRWGGWYSRWKDPMHFEWVGLPGFGAQFAV